MGKTKLEKWRIIAIIVLTVLAILSFILIWAIVISRSESMKIFKRNPPQDSIVQISTSFWTPNPNGVLFFTLFKLLFQTENPVTLI